MDATAWLRLRSRASSDVHWRAVLTAPLGQGVRYEACTNLLEGAMPAKDPSCWAALAPRSRTGRTRGLWPQGAPVPWPELTRAGASRSRTRLSGRTAAELGYEGASVEGIARRAGVGKQTIYRWWPSKDAVVLEALDDRAVTINDFPDSGDIVEDLRVPLVEVTEQLGGTELGAAYQGFLAAAQSDAALSRTHLDRLIEPANAACRRRLALARERGEIRADVEDQTIIDLLWGPIYYRLLLHTRPLDPQQVDAALRVAFDGLHQPTADHSADSVDQQPTALVHHS